MSLVAGASPVALRLANRHYRRTRRPTGFGACPAPACGPRSTRPKAGAAPPGGTRPERREAIEVKTVSGHETRIVVRANYFHVRNRREPWLFCGGWETERAFVIEWQKVQTFPGRIVILICRSGSFMSDVQGMVKLVDSPGHTLVARVHGHHAGHGGADFCVAPGASDGRGLPYCASPRRCGRASSRRQAGTGRTILLLRRHLRRFRKSGWNVTAVWPSAAPCRLARPRPDRRAVAGAKQSAPAAQSLIPL